MVQGVLMRIAFQKAGSSTSASSVALARGAFLLSASVGVAQTVAKHVFTPKATPAPSSTQAALAAETNTFNDIKRKSSIQCGSIFPLSHLHASLPCRTFRVKVSYSDTPIFQCIAS
jgi:hypothetical protein